jgi:hypothetical protein
METTEKRKINLVALQKLKLCIGYIPARIGKNLLDKLRS